MKTINSTKAWLIISLAIVLFCGAAVTYSNFYYPSDPSNEAVSVASKKADSTPKDWLTYKIDPLNRSFKYPKEWGVASISSGKVKVDSGYSYAISFKSAEGLRMGFASTDMVAGRGGLSYEMINTNPRVKQIVDCNSFKTITNSGTALTNCKDILSGEKKIGILLSYNFPEDSMTPGKTTEAYYFTNNSQFPVVGLEKSGDSAETLDTFEKIIKSFQVTESASTPSTTNSAASSPSTPTTSAADWKAYTNDTYGFGLTFTDGWKGYRIKEVDLEGTYKTLYLNVPTTDSFYSTETESHYAGYAAPFAIGIIEKSQWTGSQEQTMDFGSKIGEKGDYVFTYSQWQACPTDLCDNAFTSTIKPVINSFTIL